MNMKSISHLLSPKFIKNLSPCCLKATKSETKPKILTNYPISQKRESLAKRLNFDPNPVKIQITDYDTLKQEEQETERKLKDLIINTPNKKCFARGEIPKGKLNIIGRGSFGTVVRGIQKGERVAVKIALKRNGCSQNELNAISLVHENIVSTVDVIQYPEFCMILMEYYPNCQSLQNVLDSEISIGKEEILRYSLDICLGLEYCHSKGVLHLDVKPKNVLLCEGVCKLCDFGNSVRVSEAVNHKSQGTILYTAPELLLGQPGSEKSDVYSFGITLWQILYRKSPYFNLDNKDTIIYKVVKFNMRPTCDENAEVFKDLLESCWEKLPENRPKIEEVVEQLKSLN